MTLIEIHNMTNILLNLKDNIKILESLNDPLTFKITICDSIKILSQIYQKIKNYDNISWEKIPTELLANIISFLPYEYKLINQYICKFWQKKLETCVSKNILLPIPKNITFSELFNLNLEPRTMAKIGNNIYFCNITNACRYDLQNSKLVTVENVNFYTAMIYSNEKYICVLKSHYINVISLNMKLISKIKINSIQGLIIDKDNNILITTNTMFYIYNLEGKVLNSWELTSNAFCNEKSRKIFAFKNEIYMVDTSYNRICVFSYEGKLNRFWGNKGCEKGKFLNPWGIAIYKDIVFVVDSGNHRIQAFTCFGKFIYEYIYIFENGIEFMNITITYNYIYLTSWISEYTTRLKLIIGYQDYAISIKK
jgi:NHL repeat.